jgi:hypothetical protein
MKGLVHIRTIAVSLALTAFALFGLSAFAQQLPLDLAGKAVDPLSVSRLTVLIFVRTDCPLSSRYAPEIQRQSQEFSDRGVKFWLVYPDPAETAASIQKYLNAYGYGLPALRDTKHFLVKKAEADITPEAAVFKGDKLLYHGRIDDRVKDFGQTRVVVTAHDLEDSISAALSGKPVPHPTTQAVGCYISDLQ